MNFREYQEETKKVRRSSEYSMTGGAIAYQTLGLVGEAGEVAEKIKKVIRDKGGIVDDETKKGIMKELGDVLWYLTQLATELGVTLDETAEMNLEKVRGRLENGKIHGDGDDR